MNDALRQSIFERARDQYESATRWSFIAIGLLAAFHLLTFSPFLGLVSEVRGTESSLSESRAIIDSIRSTSSDLSELENVVNPFLEFLLDELLLDLQRDFSDLDSQIFGRADEAFPDDVEIPQMQMQMPMQEVSKSFVIEPTLMEEIRTNLDIDKRRDLVTPIVDEQIISRRFGIAQREWDEHLGTTVEPRLLAIEGRFGELSSVNPIDAKLMKAVHQTIDATLTSIRNFRITPPEVPTWWSSVAGKEQRLLDIGRRARRDFEQHEALAEITRNLEQSLAQRSALLTALENDIKILEQSFEDQKAQLTQFSSAFSVIPADLDSVANHFPAILGAMLCGLWLWQARRTRDLAAAVQLIDPAFSQPDLRHWLDSKLSRRAAGEVTSILLSVAAVWLWVGFAAYQLIANTHLTVQEVWPSASAAAFAAAIGRGSLHTAASAAHGAKANPADEGPPQMQSTV